MESTTRLQQVVGIVRKKLRGRNCRIKIVKHRLIEDTEYLYLIVLCSGDYSIYIREFTVSYKVIRYSYQLVVSGKPVLRYDNAPHHPEVSTHPHHKHRGKGVYPLHEPTLEAFLDEVVSMIP